MRVCFSEVFACQTVSNDNPVTLYQQPYTVSVPWTGTYPVTVTFTGSNGEYLDVDKLALLTAPTILTVGNSFQDTSPNLTYNGVWISDSNASYDGGSAMYTGQSGASVSFTVTVNAGDRLQLKRTASPDHGLMQLCIGVQCTTFSNYGLPTAYQQPINLLMPNAGTFAITLTNLGSSGQYMDFDSVSLSSAPSALSEGTTYQETDARLIYSGQWIDECECWVQRRSRAVHLAAGLDGDLHGQRDCRALSGALPHQGTDKGPMEICFSQIYNCQTVGNSSASTQYQQPISIALPWTAVYPVTVRFTGSVGQYMDIDKVTLSAVQVLSLPEPIDTPTLAVTEPVTPEVTESITETPTPEATETITPEVTENLTEIPSPEATETVTLTPTDLPTALPFPTLALPTDTPTIEPTPLAPLALPAYASMDDGAPDWLSLSGWTLTPDAAFGGQGLGWQVTANNRADVLRWDRLIDLTTVLPGQAVLLSFESLLVSDRSVALVQVSIDGINWTTVAMPSSAPNWQQQVIDLTGYAGAMVRVQFLWQGAASSDGQPVDSWQVDEVSVMAVSPATSTPTPTEPPPAMTESPAPTESVQPTPEPHNAINGGD